MVLYKIGGGRIWLNPPYSRPLIEQFVKLSLIHILESHQSFMQRMKSNDKEAAFKKWKEEYYGRTKKQTTGLGKTI